MKIEIDLTEILHDEHGDPSESLADSIRRQVIEEMTRRASKDVKTQVSAKVNEVLNEQLASVLKEKLPSLIEDILEQPYTPVGRFGERATPTTFRAELVKAIHENMTYKPSTYTSDQNLFTKAVNAVLQAETVKFQKEFQSLVSDKFMADALAYAQTKLAERLGLRK